MVPDIFTINADAGCSSRLQEKCQPGDDPGDDEDWYVGEASAFCFGRLLNEADSLVSHQRPC